jgi:superoxide dismutase, Fe-Mn family
MTYPFALQPLAYDVAALEPHIDALTMQIHHGKHHAAYVNNLNATLEKAPEWQKTSLDELLQILPKLPETIRTAIKNNGGGVWNHNFFWKVMGPRAGGTPQGAVADAINASFGSFEKFKEQFQAAAMGRFGSGWAWLIVDGGKLHIESTANQESPVSEKKQAILTVDVWEHAYYLKYQNRRADYLQAWWNVVRWDYVAELFAKSKK